MNRHYVKEEEEEVHMLRMRKNAGWQVKRCDHDITTFQIGLNPWHETSHLGRNLARNIT